MYVDVDEYATCNNDQLLRLCAVLTRNGYQSNGIFYAGIILYDYTMVYLFFLFAVADFLGEKLAWFFGITTPKYQYIIDEYHRIKEEVSDSCYCQHSLQKISANPLSIFIYKLTGYRS